MSMTTAASVALPKPYASGNWCSLTAVGDRLYFSLCSHRIDEHAQVHVWDCREERLSTLAGLDDLYAAERGAVGQGKVHTGYLEHEGWLYWGTHFGYYRSDLQGRRPYPGGHLVAMDLASGRLEDRGIVVPGEGIVALHLDPRTRALYIVTWPSATLVRYDLAARRFTSLGSHQTRPRADDGACRHFGTDPTGRPVLCRADGAVLVVEDDGTLQTTPVNLIQAVGRVAEEKGFQIHPLLPASWRVLTGREWPERFPKTVPGLIQRFAAWPQFNNMWSAVLADAPTGDLIALSGVCSMAFRLRLEAGEARYLGQLCPDDERGLLPRMGATSAACWGGGRVLYHLSARFSDTAGGAGFHSRIHLLSLDADTGQTVDHGRVAIEDGRELVYAYTLARDSTGRLATVAWVDLRDPERIRELAATHPPPIEWRVLLPEANPYEMRLVFIDPPRG